MDPLQRLVRRPLSAFLILVGVYALCSLLVNPGGYLGADTGAKVYTLEVMERENSWNPDIGYWAEDLDPSGELHPVYQTRLRDDGSWVAVTTLPMLELAYPLYRVGGYPATLAIPIVAGAMAAVAARSVARRVRPTTDGWATFWVVGLASPVLVYSLDLWEHGAGLAAMTGAVAILLGTLDERPWWTAAFAGALLGLAAVMRNEAFVYTLVVVGVVCVEHLRARRKLLTPILVGSAVVVGFAVPWAANVVLESGFEGPSRGSRATGRVSTVASTQLVDELGQRAREGMQTLVGLVSGDPTTSVLLGGAVVAAVVAAWRAERRADRTFALVCVGAAGAVYLADALGGLGFVPGLLVAFPIAVAGLLADVRNPRENVVVVMAVVALPIVYLFQYLDAAGPQWGGRYSLTSGILLGVIGMGALASRHPLVPRALVGLSLAITMLGFAWLIQRSHGVDEFFGDLEEVAEPVLIARQGFILREGGAAGVGKPWLSTDSEAEFSSAVDLARESGADRFSVLEWKGAAPPESAIPADATEVDRWALDFVGTPIGIVTYEFEP
ncbi:hypothetical protein [Actinospongicola halichondriae]|uniref:hypothetical protein n=1 Tax=Actinospongicola halichondriae TaxID=3236844 RepID=UPI003D3DE448